MITSHIRKRVERVEATLAPSSDGTFTLEEHCRSPFHRGLPIPTPQRPLILMALPKCKGVGSPSLLPSVGKARAEPEN